MRTVLRNAFNKLRSKLFFKLWFGIITILIIGFALSGILLYRQLRNNTETRSREYVLSSYKLIENGLSGFIDQYELIAKNMYTHQKINDFLNLYPHINRIDYNSFTNANDIIREIDNILNNSVEMNNMLLILFEQNLISDGARIIRDLDYIEQEAFHAVLHAKGENVWRYFYNKSTNRHEVALLKYMNIGKPGGILVIELDESYLYHMININDHSKNSIFILDSDGVVITSNERNAVGSKLPPELSRYVVSEQGVIHRLQLDGSQKYVYSHNLHDVFNILVMYDVEHLVQDNRAALFFQLLLLTVLLVSTIFFVLAYGTLFARRIKMIVDKMSQIQQGKQDIKITVHSRDELAYMDKSLYELACNMTEMNKQILDSVRKQNELELKFLQMQIKPHFLYNSLSSIRWLSVQQGESEISDLLENLIQFYKISLSKGKDVIPLKDEIELVMNYAALENLVHKDQIFLDVYIAESLSDMSICKMTLQPFVENSIHHGKPVNEPLNIWISIEEVRGMVEILIEDDGVGVSPEITNALNHGTNEQYSNFGVYNTLSRLKMLYGGAELTLSSKSKGAVVGIIIPYPRLNPT